MPPIPIARAHLAVACARVVEDVEASGGRASDRELTDLGALVALELDSFAVVLGAATGRGRTDAGDELAGRLWAELGGRL